MNFIQGDPFPSRAHLDVYRGGPNTFFRLLVRSTHLRYKAALTMEKSLIAAAIYDAIAQHGGRFIDVRGNLKSKTQAMKQIKKALKDAREDASPADIVGNASAE
jgi:hypothetical protein